MSRPELPRNNNGTHVLTGARCIFLFNDSVVAFAQGVSVGEEIMTEPVEVLNELAVKEHAPTGYRATLSAQMFRTIAPVGAPSTEDSPGSIKEQNIFPKYRDILYTRGVTACVQDSISGKLLLVLLNVKCVSYNYNVTARGIVGQNMSFVTTRAMDESEGTAPPTA